MQDGKPGFNTSPERGADTFVPFRSSKIKYIDQIAIEINKTEFINLGFRPKLIHICTPRYSTSWVYCESIGFWYGIVNPSNAVPLGQAVQYMIIEEITDDGFYMKPTNNFLNYNIVACGD